MTIKQVETNVIVNDLQSGGTLRIEDHLPLFEKLHEELLPAIDLKKIAEERTAGVMKEINLYGFFDTDNYTKRYGECNIAALLEKIQEVSGHRLIVDTSGSDWEVTIYDDYIE